MIDNFLKYYESLDSRPVFDSVEGMLKWSGLYNLTKVTLQEKLSEAQLSPLLVNELVTVSIHSLWSHFNLLLACGMVPLLTKSSIFFSGYNEDKLWAECTYQWTSRCSLFGWFWWRFMVC